VVEAGTSTLSLSLHPRLTVIAGLGGEGRNGLCGELIGSLGPSRAGVHVEVVDDRGLRLAIFRPDGGRHRVVEVDAALDVTDRYRGTDGCIDLLAGEGLDHRAASHTMRFGRAQLVNDADVDQVIDRLAGVDQTDLWATAARLRVTTERVEAEDQDPVTADPDLRSPGSEHRGAAARWAEIAGDIGVGWALDHHEAITAAARMRRNLHDLDAMSTTARTLDSPASTDLAQALVVRMARNRTAGSHNESFPLILDEPFAGLDANVKPALLELLWRTAGSPQAILLTDDEAIASWARLEALAGDLLILEPTPRPDTSTARHSVA